MSLRKRLQRFVMALALAAALVGGACNTTEGFGEDMESAGENIQDAADD